MQLAARMPELARRRPLLVSAEVIVEQQHQMVDAGADAQQPRDAEPPRDRRSRRQGMTGTKLTELKRPAITNVVRKPNLYA